MNIGELKTQTVPVYGDFRKRKVTVIVLKTDAGDELFGEYVNKTFARNDAAKYGITLTN